VPPALRRDAGSVDGRIARIVAVTAHTMRALAQPPTDTPLIAHLRTGEALPVNVIGWLFERIFARVADQLQANYPGTAVDLRRASTHRLPHTYANHALDAGTDIRDVQATLGHASFGTATLYTKADDARRFAAATRLLDEALDTGADSMPDSREA